MIWLGAVTVATPIPPEGPISSSTAARGLAPSVARTGESSCVPAQRREPANKGKNARSRVVFRTERDGFAEIPGYSAHMNFRADPVGAVREYLALFEAWHPNCTALDVGGRNGEWRKLFKRCAYKVLERDPPLDPEARAFTVTCDLYDCREVPECSADVVVMSNVLEHMVDPKAALVTVGRLLRPGGLLGLWSPWSWRYHAQPTYGDYYRFSTRGLEVLCLAAGLNPVVSFYEHHKANRRTEVGGKTKGST